MSIEIAARIGRIKPSATLTITARAGELRAQGRDIISLSTGEPDFDTPAHIKAAAKQAIDEGFTKYTPIDGIPSLKDAIIDKLDHDNRLHYAPNQILVSTGAKQSLFNIIMSLINAPDEVIIPAPYWVSYPDLVLVAGGTPIILETTAKQNFKITPNQLKQALTDHTRLLILNSPSNPTGTAYSEAELKKLGEVLLNYPNVHIISDDIYEHIHWGKAPFSNIVMACPELYDRTTIINGVSKAYSMTGWRIGYAAGPATLIAAMKKLQSQSTSNACSIAQRAALSAIAGSQECVSDMSRVFKSRHDKVLNKLQKLPGIQCTPTDGTFYIFPNIQDVILSRNDIHSDIDFAEQLLVDYGVATVPGTAFGSPGHIRISIATSLDLLEKALSRIEQFLNR